MHISYDFLRNGNQVEIGMITLALLFKSAPTLMAIQ